MNKWLKLLLVFLMILIIMILIINLNPGLESWLHELTGWS